MSKLKPTKAEQTKIFNDGYGQIRMYVVASFGMTTEYIKNPNMSQSQIKKAPTFIIKGTDAMIKQASKNKVDYENKNKTITILEYAKKVAKANKGKITYKSKSGSVYLLIGRKTVRISDHFILDRDVMNPKEKHNYEIVQRGFSDNDGVIIDFK